MEDFFKYLWFIGIWTIIWTVIQHWLNKSRIKEDRIYQFNKEELLFYRKMWEKLIQKIMLLDNHREVFYNYLQLSFEESKANNNIFIDTNDTFNKDKFEKEQEEIATYIFLYFSELSEEWNVCLNLMWKIHSNLFLIDLNKKIQPTYPIDWDSEIKKFNELQEKLWDKPFELSNKIKQIIKEKEITINN